MNKIKKMRKKNKIADKNKNKLKNIYGNKCSKDRNNCKSKSINRNNS